MGGRSGDAALKGDYGKVWAEGQREGWVQPGQSLQNYYAQIPEHSEQLAGASHCRAWVA